MQNFITKLLFAILIVNSTGCQTIAKSQPPAPNKPTYTLQVVTASELRESIRKSYAQENHLTLEEAERRLSIIGNSKVIQQVRDYFGDELTGLYYGVVDNVEFGLNVRTTRQGGLTAKDNAFIKTIFDTTKVPVNIQFNAKLNEEQLVTIINQNREASLKITQDIEIQTVGYDIIEDVIDITFYSENQHLNMPALENQFSTLYGYPVKLFQTSRLMY